MLLDETEQALTLAGQVVDYGKSLNDNVIVGQVYIERGDFPQALITLQQAVDLARTVRDDPTKPVAALNALTRLYTRMKEYDKAYASLDELLVETEKLKSPGRMVLAKHLRIALRETDMIVRWGGEEFLAFLPAGPRHGLDEIARRILTELSSQTVRHQEHEIAVTVSVGFAPFPLAPGGTPLPWERVVNLVDMALYLAKSNGRNRAYGVRGFANFERTSMEAIEQTGTRLA